MAYQTKPAFVKKGSVLYGVLQTLAKNKETYKEEFDLTERKDGLYPSARHGFAKVHKNGRTMITAAGKQIVKQAR